MLSNRNARVAEVGRSADVMDVTLLADALIVSFTDEKVNEHVSNSVLEAMSGRLS